MKTDIDYTEKEIESWCNIFDQNLVTELWESFMIPEDVPFAKFLKLYQKKHCKKYGKKLIQKI
jgi:hypothetical protein